MSVISPGVKTSFDYRQTASVVAQAFRDIWGTEQDISKDSSCRLFGGLRSILRDNA